MPFGTLHIAKNRYRQPYKDSANLNETSKANKYETSI